jgi:hypothetical protein
MLCEINQAITTASNFERLVAEGALEVHGTIPYYGVAEERGWPGVGGFPHGCADYSMSDQPFNHLRRRQILITPMKWFTGTPCNFEGTQAFFDRESGLTMRGFSALGIESGSITLGPAQDGDFVEMIRATWEQLEAPAWWESLHLDGLVFYTWGDACYVNMVRAAMEAGIMVAQVSDGTGIMSPVSDWKSHLRVEAAHFWYKPRWWQLGRSLVKIPYTHTLRLLVRDIPFARAMVAGDLFLAPTPEAAERFKTMTRRLIGRAPSEKVHFVPIPVNFYFRFEASDKKQNEVIAVGRWDSIQKRTPLLIKTISLALAGHGGLNFRIFGKPTPELESWHQCLGAKERARVHIEGVVGNATLAEAYRRAKVILVSSAYEGCHNSSAEAVCSGASVVACRSAFLGAIEWHTSKHSGSLSTIPTAEALSRTLLAELTAWDCGERDPLAISQAWTRELHPDRVAARILELFGQTPPIQTP